MMTSGSSAMARASAMRRPMPPESSPGRRPSAPRNPTAFSSITSRSCRGHRRSAAPGPRSCSQGFPSPTIIPRNRRPLSRRCSKLCPPKKAREPRMGIVDRVKNIPLTPKTEWDVTAAETTPNQALVTGYVRPLALIAALAGFLSSAVIGHSMGFLGGTFRMPILWALAMLVFHIVAGVAGVYLLAFIVEALAPTLRWEKNFNQARKLVAYAYTAGAGGAGLGILPYLGRR